MTGIIEADWLPYPFTMNWQIVRPGRVRFEEGEPFCFIFPVAKQALSGCEVEIHRLADNPELSRRHDAFRNARDDFLGRVRAGDEAAIKEAWQRYYFTGRHPDGERARDHLSKLRLKEPVDCRPQRAVAGAAPVVGEQPKAAWAAGSLLDHMLPGETDDNRRGRARSTSWAGWSMAAKPIGSIRRRMRTGSISCASRTL